MTTRGQRWLHDLDEDDLPEVSREGHVPPDDQNLTREERLDQLDPARRADLEQRARATFPVGAYVPRQILEIKACDLLDREVQP